MIKRLFSTLIAKILLGLNLALLVFSNHSQAQWLSHELYNGDTINRIDKNGMRYGLWRTWDNHLQLAMVCHYVDDKPVGKISYYKKNKTLLEIEPHKTLEELSWKYFGNAKPQTGKIKRGRKKVEFYNAAGKKLKKKEMKILVPMMETEASYVGGFYELFKYFKENLKYPPDAKSNKKQGTVKVSFVVKENGLVDDVSVVEGFDPECDEAALKIVRSLPRWRAATKIAYPVESRQMVPIRFKF